MTQKSHTRRAIVIGGSIAGLFVGAFLCRIGWRVDIYERSSIELIGRGAGIFATHLELFESLDKCGAGTVDIGVIVYKRVTFDRAGEVIAEKPPQLDGEFPCAGKMIEAFESRAPQSN
jgi:2-polyprenyl-6-methoxyphenol hydroxylase-like FAD-dependent oxidoreductase